MDIYGKIGTCKTKQYRTYKTLYRHIRQYRDIHIQLSQKRLVEDLIKKLSITLNII